MSFVLSLFTCSNRFKFQFVLIKVVILKTEFSLASSLLYIIHYMYVHIHTYNIVIHELSLMNLCNMLRPGLLDQHTFLFA